MTIKTPAELAAEISTLFADNTSGAITPASLRIVMQDMVDSLQSSGLSAPVNTVTPGVPSGTQSVGSILTAQTGVWSANPNATYTYQWRRTGVAISGATSVTYTLASADAGNPISVLVTATNSQGSASAASAATGNIALVPSITAAPTLSSASAVVGASLSCTTGTWAGVPTPTFTYQWAYADVPNIIIGATSSVYTPVTGDIGHTLRCQVTATNSAGSATANSTSTTAVSSASLSAPLNTSTPFISGNPWPSSTLTANNGTWSGNPTPTFTYQWKSGGTNISGATSQTYVVTSANLGAAISCAVTGTNSQGSASATSASVTIVEVPLITATPAASTLYVSEGDSITAGFNVTSSYSALFAGTDTTDITFSNQAGNGRTLANVIANGGTCDALIGTNPGKVNYVLSVLIGTNDTATAGYYPSNAALFVSDLQAYVTARKNAGFDVVVFTILPRNNSSFDTWIQSVNTGILTLSNCTAIDLYNMPVMGGFAATSDASLYPDGLHPSQRGDNYIERFVAAPLSARMTIAAGPTIAAASITGSTVDGQILTAVPGTIAGHPNPVKSYQWKRNGTNISGATLGTYTLQPADVGTTITVVITVTNLAGSASATSSATATITEVPAPTNTVAPVINGTATQGQTLTVTSNGTWTNSPSGYTYVWKRSGATISGATASTYVLSGTDVGTNITCVVTATNPGGTGTATSNSIGPIAASTVYVLNTISATSVGAYSTRKLKGSYAGSAITVRRSSDNATQDIGFDGSGNLDTAALATFVGANSAFVTKIFDQSGTGSDLVQATTGDQPRIVNAGTLETINSLAAMRFGLSASAVLSKATGFPTTPFSVGVVAGQATSPNFSGLVSSGDLGGANFSLVISNSSTGAYDWSGGLSENTAGNFTTLGQQASIVDTWASGERFLYVNGSARNAAIGTSPTLTATQIAIGNAGTGRSYPGLISEVILFSSVLSRADRKALDQSHASYWGTAGTTWQDTTIFPAQTSDTAPSGYVTSASTTFSPTYAAWHAFDQDPSTNWMVSSGSAGTIARQLPSAVLATGYAISATYTNSGTHDPTDWTFEGSNNGTSWTTLDTRSAQSWKTGQRTVYGIAAGARGSYTYYRLNITNGSATFIGLGQVEFFV